VIKTPPHQGKYFVAQSVTWKMRVAALIVAAGRGHRAGTPLPKQYVSAGGRALLHRTASAFLDHPRVDVVQIVINPVDRALYDAAVAGLDLPDPCPGGATRQESVRKGLEHLAQEPPDLVLIHDGARPFVSAALIDRVIDGLAHHKAVLPVLRVTDTIKQLDGEVVAGDVDRSTLGRAQTPQGFHFAEILAAHEKLARDSEMTDDAAVAHRAGITVHVLDGDERNIKVTTPEDIANLAGHSLVARTGMGFDVHRLGGGDHVTLCGVRIDHGQGLIGHSDADVALHALTDALMGAAGTGDIGRHFPPSDPQWKGAPSHLFVEKAVALIAKAGGRISNVDLTIICEAPKIAPHAEKMREALAGMLGIAKRQINVKATTTEKLGFTGRGEGIAAQAVATILMPWEQA